MAGLVMVTDFCGRISAKELGIQTKNLQQRSSQVKLNKGSPGNCTRKLRLTGREERLEKEVVDVGVKKKEVSESERKGQLSGAVWERMKG